MNGFSVINPSLPENRISHMVIGAALKVHSALGPGLLESVYEKALTHDLMQLGLEVKTQVEIPIVYKGIRLNGGFRIDLLVEDVLILEIKSVHDLAPIHYAQVSTYLKLADKRLALLLNFNNKYMKEGIHRITNNLW